MKYIADIQTLKIHQSHKKTNCYLIITANGSQQGWGDLSGGVYGYLPEGKKIKTYST